MVTYHKKLIILFVLAVLFALIIFPIFRTENRVYEHYTGEEESSSFSSSSSVASDTSLTDIDVEALQNLSSMYNNDTGTLTVTNLKVNGEVKAEGGMTVSGDLNVDGTSTVSGPTYSKHYGFTGAYNSRSDVPDTTAIYKYSNRVNVIGADGAYIGSSDNPTSIGGGMVHTDDFLGKTYRVSGITSGSTASDILNGGVGGIMYSTGNDQVTLRGKNYIYTTTNNNGTGYAKHYGRNVSYYDDSQSGI